MTSRIQTIAILLLSVLCLAAASNLRPHLTENVDVYVIDGFAYQSNLPDEPGQLKVKFDSDEAAPFPAPYWVLELGPINVDGMYDWAIVSDNLSYFLFVLARNPQEFKDKYDSEVQGILSDLGFTGHTKPIETYQ